MGRNPALTAREFIRFQELLNQVDLLLKDPSRLDQVHTTLNRQLETIDSWCNKAALAKRVQSREPLDMGVNYEALGFEQPDPW